MNLRFGANRAEAWQATLVALLGFVSSVSSINAEDGRLWLDAKINGTPARLCFDTGSPDYLLTADAAKRFGLNTTNTVTKDHPAQPAWWGGTTETCVLNLQGTTFQTQFTVLNLPPDADPDFDGVVGWSGLKRSLVRIFALGGLVTFPQEVDEQLAGWTRLSVATNFWTLELEVPRPNGTKGIIRIDTGNPMGVMLPAGAWRAWRKSHPHCPITLNSSLGLDDGVLVQEESWATNITIGPLVINDVPVAEAPPQR